VEINEECQFPESQSLIPVDETSGEQKLNFSVPIVEKPTLIEKAKVVYNNATEYAKVELHNVKEHLHADLMNTGEVIKEGLDAFNNKCNNLIHKVEDAVQHVFELDQARPAHEF
jgi:hypothetical protein